MLGWKTPKTIISRRIRTKTKPKTIRSLTRTEPREHNGTGEHETEIRAGSDGSEESVETFGGIQGILA